MKEVWLEYRSLVERLETLQVVSKPLSEPIGPLLQILRGGWLTPGREILSQLEMGELTLPSVLRRPRRLQRKWFSELNALEKSRWIAVFWGSAKKEDLPKMLGLSKRRLQQLLNPAKRVSQGTTS